MARTDFSDSDCPVTRALDEIGDIWSFLIVREAMQGVSKFTDFQKDLKIARKILVNRLNQLVENEIFEKIDKGVHGNRFEYYLTEKGRQLYTVLMALCQWADDWVDPRLKKLTVNEEFEGQQPVPQIILSRAKRPSPSEDEIDGESC